jgi:hypothetical protein
LALAFVLGL